MKPLIWFWSAILLAVACPSLASADDCAALEPKGGVDNTTNFEGKIAGKVDGLFSKLAGVEADINGVYSNITKDIVKEYGANAPQLFIWERIIYLQCRLIVNSDMNNDEKQKAINNLVDKLVLPPPQQPAKQSRKLTNNSIASLKESSNSWKTTFGDEDSVVETESEDYGNVNIFVYDLENAVVGYSATPGSLSIVDTFFIVTDYEEPVNILYSGVFESFELEVGTTTLEYVLTTPIAETSCIIGTYEYVKYDYFRYHIYCSGVRNSFFLGSYVIPLEGIEKKEDGDILGPIADFPFDLAKKHCNIQEEDSENLTEYDLFNCDAEKIQEEIASNADFINKYGSVKIVELATDRSPLGPGADAWNKKLVLNN